MTAHTTAIMFDDHHTSAAADARAAILPFPAGAEQVTEHPDLPGLALDRLRAFLDYEGPGLARVVSLLALSGAQIDLRALGKVLSEPADPMQALADAERILERLIGDLAEVPARTEVQRAMEAGEAATIRDLEACIRWLGARTEEMRDLVRHTLG